MASVPGNVGAGRAVVPEVKAMDNLTVTDLYQAAEALRFKATSFDHLKLRHFPTASDLRLIAEKMENMANSKLANRNHNRFFGWREVAE